MRRPSPPLFLPGPTRLAAIGRKRAWVIVAAAAFLWLLASILPAPDLAPDLPRQIAFHDAIADRIRHGAEDYYTATAAALRGSDLPLRPFTAFPPPITATVAAALPGAMPAFMLVIATWAAAMWSARFSPSHRARHACLLLALGGTIAATWSGALVLPQLWSGLFIALSIALRRPGRWVDAAASGLAAAIVHEGAMLYLAVMAVAAWRDHARREGLGWLGALALAAIVIGFHAHAAADAMGLLDPTAEWMPAGPLAAIAAVEEASGLRVLPASLAAPAILLTMAGWAMWRHPVAARVLATIVCYLVLLAILPASQAAAAFLIVPLVLLGLLPAVDSGRDLIAGALDRRRITVTRVVR